MLVLLMHGRPSLMSCCDARSLECLNIYHVQASVKSDTDTESMHLLNILKNLHISKNQVNLAIICITLLMH